MSEIAQFRAYRFRKFIQSRSGCPLLVVAAHPDDETIGAGVLISRIPGTQILHVTDGAPLNMADATAAGFGTRESYADARRLETQRALARAGVPPTAIHNLGFVDQGAVFRLEQVTRAILDGSAAA